MKIENYVSAKAPIRFKKKIRIVATGTVVGKKESEGPLAQYFDRTFDDALCGEKSFEKAESMLCGNALEITLGKAGIKESAIDVLLGGDLLNQCCGSGYGLANFDIPYLGLYGACSTFAEGLITASLMIDSEHISSAAVVVSSHFCSAERQFRYPLGYGSFQGPTAQNTVTGAGAFLLFDEDKFEILSNEKGVYVTQALPGIVCDRGIKDAGNMGAAMCSAAADTICRFAESEKCKFEDFDFIATGDLGWEGNKLLSTLLGKEYSCISNKLRDCGLMIYDLKNQKVCCGGSGCGCSAVVTGGYFFENLKRGNLKKIGVIGTGAMMSTKSLKQGESIPAIAHFVTLCSGD